MQGIKDKVLKEPSRLPGQHMAIFIRYKWETSMINGRHIGVFHSGNPSREMSQTGSQIKSVLALTSMQFTKIRTIIVENILEMPNHLHKKTKQQVEYRSYWESSRASSQTVQHRETGQAIAGCGITKSNFRYVALWQKGH